MDSRSGKVSPEILLVLAIVALGCFVAVSYYETKVKFDQVKAQIDDSRTDSQNDVKELTDQLNKRYLQLLKLAENLAMQEGRLVTIERSIGAEKDSIAEMQDTFKTDVESIKRQGGEQTKEVALLEDKFKTEIDSKTKTIGELQDEFKTLKNLMDDQSALLVMIREQAIVSAASNGTTPPPAVPAAPSSPIDISVQNAPPGAQSPQSYQADAIVPIPSQTGPAPQPTTPQPTPMLVHDADGLPSTNAPASPVAPVAPLPVAP